MESHLYDLMLSRTKIGSRRDQPGMVIHSPFSMHFHAERSKKFKMTKTDQSKHAMCIALIKRSTRKPYDFQWTKFYESNSEFPNSELGLDLTENELLICSTVMDAENYSILTTQRLVTKEKGIEHVGNVVDAVDQLYGDFKGYQGDAWTFGLLQLANGMDLTYFIETGNASMIMIYGVRTLLRTQKMTTTQIENTTRVVNKHHNK